MNLKRDFYHRVEYDFDETASVEEIAASLLAGAALVDEAFDVLESLIPDLKIESRHYSVSVVRHQSPLMEEIKSSIVLTFQEHIVDVVPQLIEGITGVDVPEEYERAISLLAISLALLAGAVVKGRLTKSPPPQQIINVVNNNLNIASDFFSVHPEMINGMFTEKMKGRKFKKLARASEDFFAPAIRHGARNVRCAGKYDVPRDVLRQLPKPIDGEAFEPDIKIEYHSGVGVYLRAHNLDSEKTGWSGVAPELHDGKVKIHVDPGLDAESLFTKKIVIANVTAHLHEGPDGGWIPFLYVVTGLSPVSD